MPPTLEKFISRFRGADRDTRLETLLDLSRKLPALPPRLAAEEGKLRHLVPECQTPVYLWVEVTGGRVQLFAEAPRESPTVRGFVSLLVQALDGATPDDVLAMPDDLLHALGLEEALGMTRTQGLSAIVRRVKTAVRDASARTPS